MNRQVDGFTVYKNPLEHPGRYVVRRWHCELGLVLPDEVTAVVPISDQALTELRRELYELGRVRFPRLPDDDPVIVECWI